MNGTKTTKWVLWSALALASVACFGSSVVAQDLGAGDEATVSLVTTGDGKPTEIPLNQIWALSMPGTRNIREIDSERPQDSQIEPIRKLLTRPLVLKEIGSAFVVNGIDAAALRQVYEVLTMGKERSLVFPAGRDASICFFAHELSWYVHVKRVEQDGNLFIIQYQFVPHEERNLTEHIAIIPVGKLLPGKYQVRMEELPLAKEYRDMGFRPLEGSRSKIARQSICKSFDFVVELSQSKEIDVN